MAERVGFGAFTAIGLVSMEVDFHQTLFRRSSGVFPIELHRLDPVQAARVLRQHGRPEQAEAVLRRAMREEPQRRDELQRALDAMTRRALKSA
ncbi:hypothetical protein ACQ86G_23995 [Roseateles chitinivorans]|uniref:hypothetical protein n=1 Tax=Roseateles chitinivorans TaxID=2917965 RepID=UPI003D67AD68